LGEAVRLLRRLLGPEAHDLLRRDRLGLLLARLELADLLLHKSGGNAVLLLSQ
jgi:hypothetical protein